MAMQSTVCESAAEKLFSTPMSGAVKQAQSAKVLLSFEPRLMADSENLHEIFLVLFNTVVHKYSSLHDHGRLGDAALTWLIEAVNHGMDSANLALNAKTVADFIDVEAFANKADEDVESSPSHKSLNNMISGLAAGGEDDATYGPVVIEYLWLEDLCSKVSHVDKYPANWPGAGRLGQYGYFRTRTKVEAMWAYVDCHEKVIKEFAGLKRFPGLTRLLEMIIITVKSDLELIEDLNPRRVFYCKHYMACRIILSRRLDELKKHQADGWISAGDVEGLISIMYERIVQVEQYFPRIDSRRATASKPLIPVEESDSDGEDNDALWGVEEEGEQKGAASPH